MLPVVVSFPPSFFNLFLLNVIFNVQNLYSERELPIKLLWSNSQIEKYGTYFFLWLKMVAKFKMVISYLLNLPECIFSGSI